MSSAVQSSGVTSFVIPRGKLTATKAGGALTIAVKDRDGNDPSPTNILHTALRLDATSGAAFEGRVIAAPLTLTIPDGARLAVTGAATAFRLWIVLFDDGGTLRLGVINLGIAAAGSFGVPLEDIVTHDATAVSLIPGSIGTIYSNAAISGKPLRLLGYMTWESGLATPGFWDTDPSAVQMMGAGVKGPGTLLQTGARSLATAFTGVAGAVPLNDTAPDAGTGNGFLNVTMQVLSAANVLEHEVLFNLSASAVDAVVGWIMLNSTTNLATAWTAAPGADLPFQLSLKHRHLAGMSGGALFGFRMGTGVVTTLLNTNAAAAGRRFGGTMQGWYTVREYVG